jgi:L-ribulose-5-phosphate 3-epimerase UlaE
MAPLTTYILYSGDLSKTYEYTTKSGYIHIVVYPDGSNLIHCENSTYQEIREAIQEIEIGIKFYGIQLK